MKQTKEERNARAALYMRVARAKDPEKFLAMEQARTAEGYHAAYMRKWREKNKEHHKAYMKEYRAKYKERNNERVRVWGAKYRKSDKGFDARLRKAFGIGIVDYNQMLEKQNGKCAICNSTKGNEKKHRLFVDHCHETNKVRGLLCGKCNTGIGYFQNEPILLGSAIDYLRVTEGVAP